jgi:hypothetical protein
LTVSDHEQGIIRNEAKKLRKDDSNITWQKVEQAKKNEVFENIKLQLQRKKIPTDKIMAVASRFVGRVLIRLKYNGTYRHKPP